MIDPKDDGVINEQAMSGPELEAAVKKFKDVFAESDLARKETELNDLKLKAAAQKFNEAFAERTFSQRHEDLGKMINCGLCGRRHRQADPIALASRAHGEQKFADLIHSFAARAKESSAQPSNSFQSASAA